MKLKTLLNSPLVISRSPMDFLLILAMALLIAPAVVTAAGNKYDIQQVAAAKVNNCKFIANVKGSSGYGVTHVTVWKNKGKHKALEQASKLNATHVVWNNDATGYGSGPRVSGSAYYCDGPEKMAGATSR
ncbi:hypothetical protein SAMN05216419_10136 [Nitrosomonas cryotolerans]|uniref:Uncharacterized protein n=1 Tax=Nitrosomonas cryotolerans ATCC 49181 TaxID=1131553 RepID=A0A1N6HZ43_9PROT|nr:hypothetical protein [Nitrosomonas cryotolerans]SFP68406.1 hypothetical protein SAMN05216419_10136 [Nitrosomonas cryotolerans]SIO25088.1 hypothetical protein SAMN02743940_1449 [Nitrosomonas cryotolerans ATCC 49181]